MNNLNLEPSILVEQYVIDNVIDNNLHLQYYI